MIDYVTSEAALSTAIFLLKATAAYVALVWAALAFWTWRDIRRRTTDRTSMALSVVLVLVGFLPGYCLYLLVRPATTLEERSEDELRRSLLAEHSSATHCPRCSSAVRQDYIVCPYCEASLRASCTKCSRAMAAGWNACPYCGTRVTAPAGPAVEGVEPPAAVLVGSAQRAPA